MLLTLQLSYEHFIKADTTDIRMKTTIYIIEILA